MYKTMYEPTWEKCFLFNEARALVAEFGQFEALQALWDFGGYHDPHSVPHRSHQRVTCGHCLFPLTRSIDDVK